MMNTTFVLCSYEEAYIHYHSHFPYFSRPRTNRCSLYFNFKKSEYRAAGQNWAVGSDEHGRVYIGNSRGLLQYNGTYWQLLPLPKGEYVRSIHMTDNGRIYVGSFEEFGFSHATGSAN